MDLEQEISTVYSGPLQEFVRRRDAVAKALRAHKRRDDADRIKALRKPGRAAAALNAVAHANGPELDQLAEAIAGAQSAHAAGVDVRAALDRVRGALRELAHAAAREGIRAGNPVDAAPLVTAINAVIGDAAAFASLRAGCLADIPEAGGMDFLATVAIAPAAPQQVRETKEDTRAVALAEAARHATQRLELAAREETAWQHKLESAESALQRAQREVESCRAQLERARLAVAEAAALEAEARRAVEAGQ